MPLGALGWSQGGKALLGKGKQNPFRNAAKPESSGDPPQSIPAGHKLLLTLPEEFEKWIKRVALLGSEGISPQQPSQGTSANWPPCHLGAMDPLSSWPLP